MTKNCTAVSMIVQTLFRDKTKVLLSHDHWPRLNRIGPYAVLDIYGI